MLAVDAVLGLASLPDGTGPLPPLIRSERVAALASAGAIDGALLVVLDATRIVPDAWRALLPREGGA